MNTPGVILELRDGGGGFYSLDLTSDYLDTLCSVFWGREIITPRGDAETIQRALSALPTSTALALDRSPVSPIEASAIVEFHMLLCRAFLLAANTSESYPTWIEFVPEIAKPLDLAFLVQELPPNGKKSLESALTNWFSPEELEWIKQRVPVFKGKNQRKAGAIHRFLRRTFAILHLSTPYYARIGITPQHVPGPTTESFKNTISEITAFLLSRLEGQPDDPFIIAESLFLQACSWKLHYLQNETLMSQWAN